MKKENWFRTKKAATIFAIASLIGGFAFLDRGITGNAILGGGYSQDLVSLIGLLLIFCSIVLTGYALKR